MTREDIQTMPKHHRSYYRAPPFMITRARELRRNMTPAERRLWRVLRTEQLDGFHFRRQDPTERYVVDFVCAKANLGIEIDGDTHAEQEDYDAARTRWLNEHKEYRVIRFSNWDVMRNIEGVVDTILEALGPEEGTGAQTQLRPPP
jgi:very-short-patch-repair endonuclease